MGTPSSYIAQILETNSFGMVGLDIFVSIDVPTDPDDMVLILDTPGFAPDFPSLAYNMARFQITVRGSKGLAQDTFDRADKINQFLPHFHGEIGNTKFVYINNISGSPASMGLDEGMRPSYTMNFTAMKSYNIY